VATEVELPQLGESVTEGVITAWLVEVGDEVEADEPVVEISTDKVDTEIPSPVAGTVTELRAEVDDTIEVGQVIMVIGDADEAGGSDDGEAADDQSEDAQGDDDSGDEDDSGEKDDGQKDDGQKDGGEKATPEPKPSSSGQNASAQGAPASGGAEYMGGAEGVPSGPSSSSDGDGQVEGEKALTSPLVRRLLREAGLKPDQVKGSGPGGRITREDAERAIASGGEGDGQAASEAPSEAPSGAGEPQQAPAASTVTPAPAVAAAPGERDRPPASPTQVDFAGEREQTQDLSRVRKAIARSMMDSLHSTAQLTAGVEVDLTRIMNLRAAKKDAFKAQEGASLSPLPLISRAVCMVLPRHPVVNSSIDTESGTVTYHRYINLGMAVDTERGLLVPNIKDAQDLTVPGLARKIGDLAKRTRNKKIQPDEISGGTFTITNTGSVGTLFDTPILNPPEVAILATCAVEKRPVVISDAYGDSIAIRWMSYLCLSYDHRMVDGADAARFLQDLKFVLETHDFTAELGV
jgi:pyruvate dehydrogenase E2 component (dihydrolipoamide acetyltransferase)